MDDIFREKEIRLMRTLVDGSTLQETVDISAEIFENPVFVCDLGYKILCFSKRGAINDKFWEKMTEYSYSRPEVITQIMRTGDFSRVYASDTPITGKYEIADYPFLAARIRDGSQMLGHICVYGYHRDFQEQDKKLLLLLCRIISRQMLYRGLSMPYRISYFSVLTDLLEGKVADREELETRMECLKIHLDEIMYLAVVSLENQLAQTTIFYIREYLQQRLRYALSIVYKDRLVFLVPKTAVEDHLLEEYLSDYPSDLSFRIGVSNSIADFLRLKLYYEQAESAVSISQMLRLEGRIFFFRRLLAYQTLLCAQKATDIRLLCDPAVLEMQAYDRQYGTEYLKDLELYLACGKNMNKAAKLAYVHKNSMYYRISRMEEKFRLDLEDEDICLSVWLSLKILQLLDK